MERAAAKIRVRLGQIEVEYEGEPAFLKQDLAPMVSELIRLYKEHQGAIDSPTSGADRFADDASESQPPPEPTRKKRRKGSNPPKGASCRSRILQLKGSGFFKDQKTPSEIVVGLKSKGWTHNTNQVGAALTLMFNSGEIQRTADGPEGKFKYYWDRD
jgi:hypothetical protein